MMTPVLFIIGGLVISLQDARCYIEYCSFRTIHWQQIGLEPHRSRQPS